MTCALWRFIYDNETNALINSHKYEKIKKIFSKMQSKRVSGSNNGMFGRKGKLSPMYGHTCFEFMSNEQIQNWRIKQSISHKGKATFKGKHHTSETKKKLSNIRIKNGYSKGKNNPMYGHSVTEYMSDEQIKLWKMHLSEAGKRRKLASAATRKKLSLLNKGKKRTLQQRKNISANHWKPKGYKHMYNPTTLESKFVGPEKFEYFLKLGFIFG